MSDFRSLVDTPYQAFLSALASLGLFGFLWLVYRIGGFLIKTTIAVSHFLGKVSQADATLNLLATNHLPHLQSEMETVNNKLSGTNEKLDTLIKYAESFILAKARE